ncbi:uncharacterized protein LOC118933965 [Manis pentadactyla]|uniref:uncharacterized protein LOC118933965 n=1 Tax=Manis pentadactyla TaxID=143292 RepID=UPI00255C75C4|nr:uncharacterized protein LOC118933965 [Manis pentadactyla]
MSSLSRCGRIQSFSNKLIDLRYPPPAEEGAVAPGILSAGAGMIAPWAVPHAQQQEARGCGVKSSRRKSSSRRGRRPGGSVALGVAWAAPWGAEEPTASCPPPLGPETRLLWTALRQKEKGGGHVPKRWKDCIPVLQHIPGTRFIAVKVPLKKGFWIEKGSSAFSLVLEQWERLQIAVVNHRSEEMEESHHCFNSYQLEWLPKYLKGQHMVLFFSFFPFSSFWRSDI